MKKILVISLVLLVILIVWLKSVKDNLDWSYKISFIDISKLFRGKLDLKIDLIVKNGNNFAINLSGLYLELYYTGKLIAKTKKESGSTRIEPKSENVVLSNLPLGILLDKYSGDMVAKIIGKKPITLDIKIGVKLFGLPIGFKTSYTTTEKDYE